jgi:hypothetical protein
MPELSPVNTEGTPDLKSKQPEKISERKIYVFIGVIGLVALFLGFMQLSQYIKGPFSPVVTLNTSTLLTSDQISEINSLKNKDTDGDGLSDYDELYYYYTSPYLKDSDSDGLSDKEEITKGTDPNCPAGQDCLNYGTNTNQVAGNANGSGNINSPLLAGDATAATLRETLKNSGVPQTILDSTSDEDLLQIYNDTVKETQTANANANGNTNSAASTNLSLNANISDAEAASILVNLTPAEIRQLLIESGLDATELSQMDDATLQAIFLKALEDQTATTANTNQ